MLAETEAAPAKVTPDRGSRLARPAARLGLAAFFLIALVGVMLGIATDSWRIDTIVQLVGFAAFAVVGTILLEQSAHRIGWICLAIGLGGAITGFSQGFLLYADAHPGTQGVAAVAALEAFVGFPATVLVFTFLHLLFPDGRLPSPRWRVVAVERRYRISAAGPASDRAGLLGDPELEARIVAIARAVVREELSTGAGAGQASAGKPVDS